LPARPWGSISDGRSGSGEYLAVALPDERPFAKAPAKDEKRRFAWNLEAAGLRE
jgi:hypothetical protein